MASTLSTFLAELRRRKVYRIAAIYATVGVAISLAVPDLFGILLLPTWAARLVIILILLGFPLALVLAWAYEVRPEEGKDAGTDPGSEASEAVVGTEDTVVGGRPRSRESIVVLPFTDLSPSGDQEYFSDGLSENLMNALTHIKEIRVAARTSAFSFKGRQVDVRDIGRHLNVGAVLEGSVQKAGNRVRITAQLINAEDGYHIWSQQYDREMADVFSIQDEITWAIVDALKIELLEGERTAVSKRHTEDLDAFHLYLKGRYYWNRSNTEAYWKAIDHFRAAIQKDPAYARAYDGMADAFASLGDAGHSAISPKDAFSAAGAAVRKALELDGGLSEAYASLGHLKMHEFAWPEAERAFRRSIELNPNYATAYRFYAFFFAAAGRSAEAAAMLEEALDLDPLSLGTITDRGVLSYFAGDYDGALAQYRKVLEMDPGFARAYVTQASAYSQKGIHSEAIAALRRAAELSGGRPKLAALGRVYARAGMKDEALEVVKDLKELSKSRYVTPYAFTLIHASLGDLDQAFSCLQRACGEGVSDLLYLKVDPFLDNLRGDPRFVALLERAGFADRSDDNSLGT
ncbi:MAG: TPR end-of-group domain-containing protein [Longimicrobiales bacterium]